MSRRDGGTDSEIEQQLSSDEGLFARMAEGAVEEEVVVTPAEEVVPQVEAEVVVDEPEIEKDDPTNEQVQTDETKVETEVEVETPHAPKVEKLYSPEEIKELVSTGDFTRIDTSRLSEEGKLVMKSMQSGLTPKLQEAAELRREMQELKESVQKAIPKAQPKDIFEAYDQDPDAVTTFLNNNVQEAIASQDQVAIERAREDREQVRHYAVTKPVAVEPQLEANNIAVEMLKAVPDIQTKQEALLKHALEVMGYEREEVEQLTNLDRGHQAVREIVRINQSYERHMAPKRAAEKEVKKTPPTVEKSGGGFEKNQTTGKDRIAQAKKSGTQSDWMDVFMNMED